MAIMCYLKVHQNQAGVAVGICDEECIGMVLNQGKFRYTISEAFYKGELVEISEATKIIKSVNNFNAAGKNVISHLLKEELIHEDGVVVIEKIPVAIRIM